MKRTSYIHSLIIMLIVIFLLPIRANAAVGNTPVAQLTVNKLSVFSNGKYFDYQRYAMDHPDLVTLYGLNKTALWNHYKSIGAFEGRIAYATNEHRTAQLRAYEIASLITNDGMTE